MGARFLTGMGEKGASILLVNVETLFSKLVLTWMPSLVIWEALLYIFAGPSVKEDDEIAIKILIIIYHDLNGKIVKLYALEVTLPQTFVSIFKRD